MEYLTAAADLVIISAIAQYIAATLCLPAVLKGSKNTAARLLVFISFNPILLNMQGWTFWKYVAISFVIVAYVAIVASPVMGGVLLALTAYSIAMMFILRKQLRKLFPDEMLMAAFFLN